MQLINMKIAPVLISSTKPGMVTAKNCGEDIQFATLTSHRTAQILFLINTLKETIQGKLVQVHLVSCNKTYYLHKP